MANASYLYNNFGQLYLNANLSPASSFKLLASPSMNFALPFTFTPTSADDFNICTTDASSGQAYCLEVWNVGGLNVHLGVPNNNGSQLWTMTPATDGFKLLNYNAGGGLYLDTNTISRDFIFSKGNWVGQIWTAITSNVTASIISQTASPTSTMADPSSSLGASPSATDGSTQQSTPGTVPQAKHNPGAIIGVAVACSLVPLIFAALVIGFFLRRRRTRKALDNVDFIQVGGSGSWSKLSEEAKSRKNLGK